MEELESNTLLQSNAHAAGATIDTREYPDRIMKYLRPSGGSIFLESYVLDRLSEDDLPHLSRALRDEAYAAQWGDVIFAICVLEEDAKALDVVKEFVSKPWDWRTAKLPGREASQVVRGIAISLMNLAMLDPEVSGPFLKEMFSLEGAEYIFQIWREAQFPSSDSERVFKADLMYGAASGLLHSRSPELLKIVEDTFHELHALHPTERSEEQRTLLFTCKQILGENEFYQIVGWDKGIAHIYGLHPEEAANLEIVNMGRFMAKVSAGVAAND
ncbi:MAG: hypothetical protein KF886_19785 [Candidatus Hydrogenedentes bacterium]|nr:hypothetical protein [Candidatus Hydrogenedentota bacterium]